jgi:hypothetical protein
MKNNFVEGDLVRIITQPKNQHHYLIGEVGVIETIEETFCDLQAIKIDGELSGFGSVPLDCLQLEQSKEWENAAMKYFRKSKNASYIKPLKSVRYVRTLEDIGER